MIQNGIPSAILELVNANICKWYKSDINLNANVKTKDSYKNDSFFVPTILELVLLI